MLYIGNSNLWVPCPTKPRLSSGVSVWPPQMCVLHTLHRGSFWEIYLTERKKSQVFFKCPWFSYIAELGLGIHRSETVGQSQSTGSYLETVAPECSPIEEGKDRPVQVGCASVSDHKMAVKEWSVQSVENSLRANQGKAVFLVSCLCLLPFAKPQCTYYCSILFG